VKDHQKSQGKERAQRHSTEQEAPHRSEILIKEGYFKIREN
jgi:hypothetical protein